MILRRGYRRRQVAEAEFFQSRQEPLLLLAAENPEHEFGGVRRAAPRHHGEDQAGEIRVVEIGDAAPSPPGRLARVAVLGHVIPRGHFPTLISQMRGKVMSAHPGI
jgi:hypothetical protein